MDFEGFIKVVDVFCPPEDQEASFKEYLSQENSEEKGNTDVSGAKKPVSTLKLNRGVTYGTVLELLYFVNLLSNVQRGNFVHLTEEMGVVLNKADLAVKGGRYRVNSDVFLFPWKLTLKNLSTGYVPKGSFGKVHLAQDTETRKLMACKQIPLADFRASEVEIQAGLRHENIAELYGAVLWDDTIHLFMEVGEGGSVLEKLDCCGPMSEPEIIWVTRQVLNGLDYLHFHRVIHHDIKPSNIVLMSTKAILVDFGLSVKMTGDIHYPTDFRGTEIYMSPEVVLCQGHTTKTDVYSLGASIIHMQSGQPPWVRRYPPLFYPSYLYIIHKQAPPLQDIAEDCSQAMRRFLRRCLNRNLELRASAAELLLDELFDPQHCTSPTTKTNAPINFVCPHVQSAVPKEACQ